ncbi:MAG TPA: copper amine oxidase N-terminal domain-containing protein, partial [Candidatus Elarobacter sp.]|nr:copper amine oxidase N-terminal domain-containing protein [Candidatus Elarobacter sp.]
MYRQLVPFVRLGVATLVPAMATIAIAAALPASSAALPPEPRASVKLYFQGSPLNAYPTLVRGYRVLGLVRNGTLLVPFDDVLAQLGATDIAVDRARVVTMRQGAHTIALRLTSRAVTIDGKLSGRMLDVAPEIVDGKLFVPLRAAAEALGASVS